MALSYILSHILDNPNAYGTSAADNFGYSVAISDKYAIVGAYGEDDAGGLDSGKAYIFDNATGALLWTLDNPNAFSTSDGDNFGYSVAISDNYAIVGAYSEDDNIGFAAQFSGKAYIFNPETGVLLRTLNNPNVYSYSGSDYFGNSVAISNNYAIVGAYQEDSSTTSSGSASGRVYIFNPETGVLLRTLNDPNAYSNGYWDLFGYSVAISPNDNYLIVSTPYEDDAGGTQSGKAYIFDPATGALLHTLNNPNPYSTSTDDYFGYSVAISNNYAIVGAYQEDNSQTITSSGKAYIFNPATGVFLRTLNNPNAYSTGTDDYFGYSVAISDNYAIVGAWQEDESTSIYYQNTGNAYMFSTATGVMSCTLSYPDVYTDYTERASAGFGYSVAISPNSKHVISIGGGKAFIFKPATPIILKNSSTSGNVPTAAQLELGELAVNTYDGKVYLKTIDDSIIDLFKTITVNGLYGDISLTTSNITQGANKYYTTSSVRTAFSKSGNLTYSSSTGALGYTRPSPVINLTGDLSGSVTLSSLSSGTLAVTVNASPSTYVFPTYEDVGAIYIVTLVDVLDNPNAYSTSASDNFGYPVAISDNYAIVGAWYEDDASGSASGKAYIFNTSTGALSWTLDNPNAYSTSANDNFGYSVAISDNYAIVGAYAEDDAGGTYSGKVYIFNPATGALLWTLNNPNAYGTSTNDYFGISVAISDNYAIVGAYNENDAGGAASGKLYIFNPATGALLSTIDNPNAYSTSLNDNFGDTVAISDNYAIVGAYFEDDAGGGNSGKAYIFNPATGTLLWTLNNPNAYSTSASDYFGISVAISNNYAIVGAYLEDSTPSGSGSGKAYIFNPATGALLWTLDDPNAYSTSANDNFGASVAISDNYAIVGAFNEDDAGGSGSGKAYIFNPSTGTLLSTIDNPNAYSTSAGDNFGYSVAISNNYAIVGAYGEDDAGGSGSGKALLYQNSQNQIPIGTRALTTTPVDLYIWTGNYWKKMPLTLPGSPMLDYYVIGGGGPGGSGSSGSTAGGGGGGGGINIGRIAISSGTTIQASIGVGGTSYIPSVQNTTNGSSSTLYTNGTTVATGGGGGAGGGGTNYFPNAISGSSGTGSGQFQGQGGGGGGPAGTTYNSYGGGGGLSIGGGSTGSGTSTLIGGGGGGGAGGNGGNGGYNFAGSGGTGILVPYPTSSVMICQGGAGGAGQSSAAPLSGQGYGGGGGGGVWSGGGANAAFRYGQNGKNGVVILKYPDVYPELVWISGNVPLYEQGGGYRWYTIESSSTILQFQT